MTMPKKSKPYSQTYHVHKVAEGGIGQREAVRLAKASGAEKVWPHSSIYVGLTAMTVLAGKRTHDAISNALFN